MSEFWARTLKIAALVLAAYLLLFLVELSGAGPMSDVERYARETGMSIDATYEYSILGRPVSVFLLNGDDQRFLVTSGPTVGYQSRFTVVAYYSSAGAEPEVFVEGASESAMVDRVLPRRARPASEVIDALSGATATAAALDRSLERSRWAVRRFREETR